jgi:hypothetical protein
MSRQPYCYYSCDAGNLELSWVELSLSYGLRSVDQFVLVSGSPLGPMTRFYLYPFVSENCFVVLPVWRALWREDGSVTYNAIADWSAHWGPITIHYSLIWGYVPSSSPLTTRKDCGGGILTRLSCKSWQQCYILPPNCRRVTNELPFFCCLLGLNTSRSRARTLNRP